MMDVGGHLRGLFRFTGRERRTTFWLWIAVSYIAQLVISMLAMVPLLVGAFSNVQRFASEHPDFGQPGSAAVPPPAELFPFMPFFGLIAFSALFGVVLIAAAVARRLHDTGRSGWWGGLPLLFQIVAFAVMAETFSTYFSQPLVPVSGPPPEFLILMVNNLLGMVSIVTLIVFCCLPTQEQPNRYGPPPGPRVG